ncbi:MAG TPA: S8 family serine peptidase [Actinomycetota bacterium]|nr:S8 family serine peptidase [Actinomycetota bacterium]
MRRAASVVGLLAALLAPAAPSPAAPLAERVELIVAFEDGAGPAARRAAAATAGATVTGRLPALGLQLWSLPSTAVAAVEAAPAIEWAEPDRTLYLFDKPNDPLLSRQWAFDELEFPKAWELEAGATSPVVVAVVDSGVEATHPDLEGRLVEGRDFLAQDDTPDDPNGHGTGVSGIIAANTDNREGIAGMSWGAKVMPLQTCGETGTCSMFAVVQAIVWAAAHDAQVVNLSLGGALPSCGRTLAAAASFAEARGTLLVAASGNSAQNGNPAGYPAACDGFMAVGATDVLNRWAAFSQYGPHLSVAAPGVAVMTSWSTETSPKTSRGYAIVDGTSFAAPHVSGLAALLWSRHPDWTPAQVRARIEQSAIDLGPEGHDPWYGYGRIDLRRALAE